MTTDASAAPGGQTTTQAAPRATRLAVDAPTRMFHALFAAAFLGAWLTAETERLRALHVTLGYTMAGLLVFRIVYGLVGPRHARLSLLWRRMAAVPVWLRSAAQRWRTPAGIAWRPALPLAIGGSIVLLLAATVPQVLTGYGTFHEWDDALGFELFEEVHETLGNAMLVLVLVHLAAVIAQSFSIGRNLPWQMVDGRAPGRGPDVAGGNRRWLAAALLVAVMGYGAWEWRQSPEGLITPAALQGWVSGGGHDDHDDRDERDSAR